jgi:hypothetical protein
MKNKKTESLFLEYLSKSESELVLNISRLNTKMKNNSIEKITSTCPDLLKALLFYKKGVNHFYDRINIDNSYLDVEAIAFMDESLLKIDKALKKTTENEITLTVNTVPQITVISKIPEKTKYFKNEIVIVKLLLEPDTEIDMEFSDFTPAINKKNFLVVTDQKTSKYTFLIVPMTESIIMDLVSKKI